MHGNQEPADSAERRDRARTSRRAGELALWGVAAAIVLSGCGGSKSPAVASVETTTAIGAAGSTATTGGAARSGSTPTQSQVQQSSLKYAECMRANGVPGFPDPSPGGGFEVNPGAGADASSPAFKAAQAKCEKYLGVGAGLAPGTQTHPSPDWLARMVRAAQCMRRHGITGFPDPTTTVPSLRRFVGVISNIEGAVFVFPAGIDTQSPVFVRAANACGFPLHNH